MLKLSFKVAAPDDTRCLITLFAIKKCNTNKSGCKNMGRFCTPESKCFMNCQNAARKVDSMENNLFED